MKNIFENAKFGDKFLTSTGDVLTYIRKSDIPDNPFPHQLDLLDGIHDYCCGKQLPMSMLGRDCYTDDGINAYAICDNWNDKTYNSIIKKIE